MPKIGQFDDFSFETLKITVKQCYQTGKKLVENVEIEKFKWDILGDFQTMWLEQEKPTTLIWTIVCLLQ